MSFLVSPLDPRRPQRPRPPDPERKLLTVRVGRNLKRARLRSGLSQSQLARKVDASSISVSRWELGKQMADPDTLWRIGEVLGVNVSSLFVPLDDEPETNGDEHEPVVA